MPVIFRIKLFLLFFLLNNLLLHAQQFDWKVGFHGIGDNREYSNSKRPSQTIFAARLSPEIGLMIDSTHRIAGGFTYLQEFGSKSYKNSTKATLYYQFRKNGLEFNIGAFNRHPYLEQYPLAMLSDTINYYQPNIEGMLLKYQNNRFHQQIWIDWENRQTAIQREQFKVGLSGQFNIIPSLYIKHYGILWHYSKASKSMDGDQIRDNGSFSVFMGTDLSHKVWLDSLVVEAGGIINFDRLRDVYDWQYPRGVIGKIYVEKKKIFLRNTYYAGQSLQIPYGDIFYKSTRYNRMDIGWIPLRSQNLEGRLTLSFHFSEKAMDNQQLFILRYLIGNRLKRKS